MRKRRAPFRTAVSQQVLSTTQAQGGETGSTALPFLFCFGFVVRGAKHDAASLRPAARIGAARRVIAALDQFTDSIFKQPRLRHCERGEAIHEATRKQEWIASLRSQ
jgi:hypothetical protein